MAAERKKQVTSSTVGFEAQLWATADKMRGHMDPAEYKHVALGLIFLKYISDAFEEKHSVLAAEKGANPEDRDEYLADNVFWVPKDARWKFIQSHAKTPQIGKIIDDAMTAIEAENPSLKGVLPKDYARPALDKTRLGELIDLISKIGMGDDHRMSKDTLGRVYEYFLSRFASAEGKGGGEFYTPQSVVQLLVEMLEPYKGRIYDPCCGSGGMFVQSEKFVEEHGGRVGDISVYGQESNFTTWRLCKMNLAIRGIESNIGAKNEDTFHNNVHKDLKADYIIANPPFNISDWGGDRLREDVRWKYGTPPATNANFGWVQHIVHHLSPRGFAGFVLANGSMSSNSGGEGEIRKNLIEANVVDCMVALPGQLFYSTQIPVCLWFLAKDRSNGLVAKGTLRDRRGEILFIDARKLGYMEDRTHKALDAEKDIQYIADCYHAWRGEPVEHEAFKNGYQDIAGFCKSTKLDEVKEHGYVLTPGRYVGNDDSGEDGKNYTDYMTQISSHLEIYSKEYSSLDKEIKKHLGEIWGEFDWSKASLDSAILMENLCLNLFKSWFINYEPVKELSQGLAPRGLSKEIQKLFPSNFVDSPLGKIPEGWNIGEIGSLIEVVGGSTPSTKNPDFWDGGKHFWATPKDLSMLNSKVLVDTERKITDTGLREISSRLLPVGTVLLSSRAPIGYVAVAEVPTAINQGFIAMKCTKTLGTQYVLNWTLSNLDVIKSRANGSTFQEISKSSFRPILVCYPNQDLLDKFEEITGSFFRRMVSNLKLQKMLHSKTGENSNSIKNE